MIQHQSCFVQGDGKYIQSGVSVEDPEFPVQSGVPRVDVCQSVIGNANCTIYIKLCSYAYTVTVTVWHVLHFCTDSYCPFNMQLHFGSGFVLEPYGGGGDNQTLISYLADVRINKNSLFTCEMEPVRVSVCVGGEGDGVGWYLHFWLTLT